jgi:uncharacterized RDD family membrane protein YckC
MTSEFGDSLNVEVPYSPLRSVAGFWRRLAAFLIDVIILCVPCLFVAFLFSEFFHYHQRTATLVGLLIVIPYFALLGSDRAGGQTFGMRVMSIEVVDRDGRKLPLARSFARYLILLIPLMATAKLLPFGTPSWLSDGVDWIFSALGSVIFYLIVFNAATRQSLHDLCTGAFVTDKLTEGSVVTRPIWTGHWKVLAGLLLAGLITGPVIEKFVVTKSVTLGEIMQTLDAVQRVPNVERASVYAQKNWANNQTTSGIRVVIRYHERPEDLDRSALEIADVVLRTDPHANGDFIAIVSDEGFRVGFFTLSNKKTVSHTPEEWKQLIGKPASSADRT